MRRIFWTIPLNIYHSLTRIMIACCWINPFMNSFSQESPWLEKLREEQATYLFLQHAAATLPLIASEDFIVEYLHDLRKRLLGQSHPLLLSYPIFVINRPDINALAISNYAIIMTTGLIAQSQNEDQIAYVMAHELGHLYHQHNRNSHNYNKYIALQSAALMILGALMQPSSENLPTLLASIQAYSQQKLLSFSRHQETQADQFAYSLLQNSPFSTRKGLEIMWLLENFHRNSRIPSYLLSHPKSQERMSYFSWLLEEEVEETKETQEKRTNYHLIREHARLASLPRKSMSFSCSSKKTYEENYIQALMSLERGRQKTLEKCILFLEKEEHTYSNLVLSSLWDKIGNSQQALEILKKNYELEGFHSLNTLYYAQILIQEGEWEMAEQILQNITPQHHTNLLYYLKAQIADHQDQLNEKYRLLAHFYANRLEWRKSFFQLEQAEKLEYLNDHQKLQLSATWHEIENKCQAYSWFSRLSESGPSSDFSFSSSSFCSNKK